jgi:hypothetical protein
MVRILQQRGGWASRGSDKRTPGFMPPHMGHSRTPRVTPSWPKGDQFTRHPGCQKGIKKVCDAQVTLHI